MDLRYYREEMRYLHEAGKAFAEAHEQHARLLNVDSVADRDPYVERLFEGFALLTGRIHERLDDEMPQYTEALLDLLWPQLLRPVPSLSVVEFRPTQGLVQETATVARGTEVRSAPVGDESTPCRFTTTWPVRLQPVRLVDATTAWPRDDATLLTLRFRLDRGVEYGRLDLRALRLYVHADPATASLVHLFLTRHVDRVVVRAANGDGDRAAIELAGQRWVRAAGYGAPNDPDAPDAPDAADDDEALLPYPVVSFPGFRLLQEYLAFRQKFWFVDLLGLDRFRAPARMTEFDVELHLGRAFPEAHGVRRESLRLGCTPVVNLFRQDLDPALSVDHRAAEYPLIPDVHRPRSVETYAVASALGVEDGTGRRHEYERRFAFGRAPSRRRWFTTSRRVAPNGRALVHVALGGGAVAELRPEKLSMELWCTNGMLPHLHLRERALTRLGDDAPKLAAVENLTQPTPELPAPSPDDGDQLWRLLSHLSLGHRSLATRDGLADLLELYDWTTGQARDANRRRIAGIRSVARAGAERVRRRSVVRGSTVALEVQDGHFPDEGDLCVFGEVLSRVLTTYATINSFVELAITTVPSGRRYDWTPECGSAAPI